MQLLAHQDDCQMVVGNEWEEYTNLPGVTADGLVSTYNLTIKRGGSRQCTCTPVAIKLANLGADSRYATNVWLVPPSFEWAERDN